MGKDQDLSVAEEKMSSEATQLQGPTDDAVQGSSNPWSTNAFDSEWETMRQKLHEMLTTLHSHVDQVKAVARKHYETLKAHMEKVKEHYKAEHDRRLAAEKAHAEAQ